MADVVLAWELGGGIGHLTVLRPIAESLMQRGHQIHLISRDLTATEIVFRDLGVSVYQAPAEFGNPIAPIEDVQSYGQLLHNCGFERSTQILGRLKAWNRLLDIIDAEIFIADHCPTLLAGARGRDIRSVLVGTGFVNPPVDATLPSLVPWRSINADQLRSEERPVLDALNSGLLAIGKPTLDRLSDLYRTDLTLITSFKELDHFGERKGFRYTGAWPTFEGDPPQWPTPPQTDNPKRIFAYFTRFPGLTNLLKELGRCGHSVIVYGNWSTPEVREQYSTESLCIAEKPLNLKSVAEQCDVAILNASHGTTATMLLGGTPILQLPTHLEQRLIAERVMRMGAGLVAERTKSETVMSELQRILADESFTDGAKRFADVYRNVDPAIQHEHMIDQILKLI